MSLLLAALLFAAPPADSSFQHWFDQDGVSVSIARGTFPPWIRAEGTIDAPADDVAAVLGDYEHYKEIFEPEYARADVLDRDSGRARLHTVWDYPWPYHDRDAVMGFSLAKQADGSWLLTWTNAAKKGDPKTGVRIEGIDATTTVVPVDAGHAKVTFTYHADLGGDFGKSGNEKAYREEPPLYFDAIRKRLKKK
jgi:hypothetical protein